VTAEAEEFSGLSEDASREVVEREYQACAAGLQAFLLCRLRDSALAEDILHDVFIAFYRQLSQTPIHSPKAYLYQSAHRLSLNAIRQRSAASKLRNKISLETTPWTPAPQADALRAAEARSALAGLEADQREVLTLKVFGGLTFREISEALDVPLATVFKRYEDAVQAMRQQLGGTLTERGAS
jgi:RNA polymerase sigma-70 factor (ECF subfamily)